MPHQPLAVRLLPGLLRQEQRHLHGTQQRPGGHPPLGRPDYEGNFALQEYLPQGLEGSKFYDPGNTPRENETRRSLKERWGEKYNY